MIPSGGQICWWNVLCTSSSQVQKGVALLSSGQYKRGKQLINTWGLKMHNCTSLSGAPVSLEESRENAKGCAISEDRPCEQLLVLSIANCDATIEEKWENK